jgi:hypothetical protein
MVSPGIVRNTLLGGITGLTVYASVALRLWSGQIALGPVTIDLAGTGLIAAIMCGVMAGSMIWSSKVGKLADRDKLLDHIAWTGRERVLDVGCGRGLLLVAAPSVAPRPSGSTCGRQRI